MASENEDTTESSTEDIAEQPIDFAALFADDSPTTVEEDPDPTPVETPTPTPPAPEPSPDQEEVNDRVATLEREVLIGKTETELLRKQLAQQPAIQRTPEAPPPGVDPRIESEQFTAKLRVDPLGAIKDVIADVLGAELPKVRADASYETEQKIALLDAANRDKADTLKEFGALIANNPEFRAEAERIYTELGADKQWRPKAMFSAASTAWSNLVRAGRLRPATIATLPTERPKSPIDSLLGEQTKPAVDKADPLGEFSGAERARISKTCKELGITTKEYVQQYSSLKAADTGYGRR